jgi:hypothetical protein
VQAAASASVDGDGSHTRKGRAPKAVPRHALTRASVGESSCDAVVSLSTDVMGGAIPSSYGTSGTVRAESVADARLCLLETSGGRRSVPATRVPSAARKSPAPPPQQRSRGSARRIRGAYFEPLSATRRGSSAATPHVSRSTNSSTKCGRITRVLPLLARFRRSRGKTPSRSSEPKTREPQRLLGFSEWS